MKTRPDPSAKRATISDLSHGKAFERDLAEVMLPLVKKHPIVWERVVDSAYAGNVIRDADCDFKLTVCGADIGKPYVFWIECKASEKSETFSENFRDLVKTNQLALMRLGERAGVCCFYMFRSEITDRIEVWSMQDIAAWYYLKRSKMLSEPKFILMDDLTWFAREIVTNPEKMRRKILS